MSLKQMLLEKANEYGGKTAIVCGDDRVSYAELDAASNKIANALIGMGVAKGDRVAVLLSNSLEFVVIYLGIAKTGGIAVPLDVRYKVEELASLFDSAQPKVLAAETVFLESIVPHLSRFPYIEHVIEIGSVGKGRFRDYEDIMAASSEQAVEVESGLQDLAHFGYTSGPTSHPKGVMLTHGHLLKEAVISGRGFEQTEEDVTVLFALPMHHVFGLVVGLLGAMLNAGTVVILPGLSVSTLLETIARERGTIFLGVPYVFHLLVDMAEQERIEHDLSSLRLCVSGGSLLPDEVARLFRRYYGLDIGQLWGLTEAAASVTCTALSGVFKLGSAGRVLPGWELKIVDDRGKELPVNRPGEVIVRGLIMNGYYRNPQDTEKVLGDGWLRTGDIGKLDKDGDLYIVGRLKEMIIVKGQNVFPVDIEERLQAHHKVAEVVVVGHPDELRGETVWAAVSLEKGEVSTEEEMKRYCRWYLANYKVPRRIVFMDALPRSADGKINREALVNFILASSERVIKTR